jgi:hypothetical protein
LVGPSRHPDNSSVRQQRSATGSACCLYLPFYCPLAPHLLSFSIQTPPAFSHSVLFLASFNPAKTEAAKMLATAKIAKVKATASFSFSLCDACTRGLGVGRQRLARYRTIGALPIHPLLPNVLPSTSSKRDGLTDCSGPPHFAQAPACEFRSGGGGVLFCGPFGTD